MLEYRKDEGGRSGTYLRRCLARPSQFPCAQLQLLRLKSNAHRLSRACRLVGTDALVAGCLGWALLTTAEVGWAPHTQAVTEMDVRMVSSRLLSLTFPFFIATVVFLSFGPAHCLESQLWAGWSLSFKADWGDFGFSSAALIQIQWVVFFLSGKACASSRHLWRASASKLTFGDVLDSSLAVHQLPPPKAKKP